MRSRLTPFFFGFLSLLLDCAPLDPLVANSCGNGVVDANEDCDTFPAGQCGAPSSGDAQCRLLCGKQPSGEALTCPDGWGCSVSGFCRQPTGTFEAASEPVSAGVTTMLVGDFDGDGKKDVLGSSGPTSKGRIHYFNGAAAPQVVALPGVLAAPTIRDFDGDGRSDIAFGYSFRGARDATDTTLEPDFAAGFAIMLGQSDRAVVTNLFPVFTADKFDGLLVPLAFTKLSGVPASAASLPVLAAATVQGAGGNRTSALLSLDPGRGFSRLLPGTIAELAGDPIAEMIFDKDPTSSCGEVVTAFTNGRVLVYSPCKRVAGPPVSAAWSTDPPKEINIPGATITRVFVADVDGDKHADLVIGTTASGGTKVRVAYGTGTDFEPLVDAPKDLTDVPLAAGFLDRDTRIDFVVPSGVLFSSSAKKSVDLDGGSGADGGGPPQSPREIRAGLSWVSVPAPTKRWTVARVADVNRDDIPDVIGASAYEPDIDVLEGTRSIDAPPFTIPTTGTVTDLAVGDFDLDANGDIAFIQARPASSQREVAISYGRALAMPPESPRTAGRLDGMRQLFATPSGLTLTSSSVNGTELPTFSFAVLLSSGERQPVAPLVLAPDVNPGAVRTELTTRALVAPTNSTGKIDLFGLVAQTDYLRGNGGKAGDPGYSVWRAQGTGPDAFDRPKSALGLPSFVAVDKTTDSFLVQMVAGDLDGDKNAELVALAPDSSGQNALMFIVPVAKAFTPPVGQLIADRAVPGGVRAQLLDADGDGNDDLVAVLRNTKTKLLQVNVFYGDGKGNLAIPPVTIDLPLPAGAVQDDYGALGFTQITTGGGAVGATSGRRHELVVVTPRHLFRALVRRDRGMDVSDLTAAFGEIRYGSAVVAGDFDGDGVEDLAVADQGSIRISRQKARLP